MAEKKEEKKIPHVSTRSRGQVSMTMEMLAEKFRKRNPGQVCRYVYDPEHKPELSAVLERMAAGYRTVMAEELGEEVPGLKPKKPVRIADVILMAIDEESYKKLETEDKELVEEQRKSIDRAYYEAMEEASVTSPSGVVHKARPIGRSIIEERDFEFDLEQRTGEN